VFRLLVRSGYALSLQRKGCTVAYQLYPPYPYCRMEKVMGRRENANRETIWKNRLQRVRGYAGKRTLA
jgi:hypothetical protein